MSFCIKCGSKLEEKDSFCPNCGEKIKNNRLKAIIIICAVIIIGCGIGYILKGSFYFEYYTYKTNKSSSPVDKLLFSDKALNYKINETSLNNYENAIKQNINNLNVVTTSLQNNKEKLSKNVYNSMMIDAYKVQLKNFVDNNNVTGAFKTLVNLNKYGYNYKNDENYKNIMLNLSNSVTNNKFKSIEELNNNYITFGDIDNDGTDEIVQVKHLLYYDFNPDYNMDPNSYVIAYKFNGQNFTKVDTLKIDVINKGSKIFIGKPNKDVTALIVDGYIGVHYGESNAYFVKDNKLKQLIPENVSAIYPTNPKDIDNDGFIEFPNMDVDPNSINQSMGGSDKIITWLKADANGTTKEVKKDYMKNENSNNSSTPTSTTSAITLDQAKNIINTNKSVNKLFTLGSSAKNTFKYSPNDNYVDTSNHNNYYTFAVYDSTGMSEADYNICVNKNTGEATIATPYGNSYQMLTVDDFIAKIQNIKS